MQGHLSQRRLSEGSVLETLYLVMDEILNFWACAWPLPTLLHAFGIQSKSLYPI